MDQEGLHVVVTNGCFDLIHAGHVTYLEQAKSCGDILLVGLNGDESVRQLKGNGRPIHSEQERALILAALECVDNVCIFPEKRADIFLEIAKPNTYVKGADYSINNLDPGELAVLQRLKTKISFFPLVAVKSTTEIIKELNVP